MSASDRLKKLLDKEQKLRDEIEQIKSDSIKQSLSTLEEIFQKTGPLNLKKTTLAGAIAHIQNELKKSPDLVKEFDKIGKQLLKK